MKTQYQNLDHYSPAENILVVEIRRPGKLNALDTETLYEIMDCLNAAESSGDVRVIIFTGSGDKAFIAGGDIVEMSRMEPLEASRYSELGHEVTLLMEESPIVTIAAINGYALGGGLEFALACDLRIASENARMGLTEVTLGAVCGFGGSQRLPRTIGISKAAEMLLTGRAITAAEALSWGLVSKVVPGSELLSTAVDLAQTITTCGPLAVRITKRLIYQGLQMDIHSALALEQHAFGVIFSSHDQKEGMLAFLEKRPPKYQIKEE